MIRTTFIKPLQYQSFCPPTSGSYCSRTEKKGYVGTSVLKYLDVLPSAPMPVAGVVDLIRYIYDPLPVQVIIDASGIMGVHRYEAKTGRYDHINQVSGNVLLNNAFPVYLCTGPK